MIITQYHGNTGQIRTQLTTFIADNLFNFLTYTFICRENNQWMSRIHSCLKSIPGCSWSWQDAFPTCLVFVSDCNQINLTKTAKLFQISSCWKHLPKWETSVCCSASGVWIFLSRDPHGVSPSGARLEPCWWPLSLPSQSLTLRLKRYF